MKLLIVTQSVDLKNPVLGFFHRWIEEFAKHAEFVTVICLEKGKFNLPSNVKVLSLGKEDGLGRVGYLLRFFKYIWKERENYDSVFVHMNPEYVILGGIFWRLQRKKIGLWYVHKESNIKLFTAYILAHKIFSSVKESFTLGFRKKVSFLGHGIDMEQFGRESFLEKDPSMVLVVGRITPIKNQKLLLEAASFLLKKFNLHFRYVLIGDPVSSQDVLYKKVLEEYIENNDLSQLVSFTGSIKNTEMMPMYGRAMMLVNMSPVGGLDKVVIEAMASGLPVLVCNPGFTPYFEELAPMLVVGEDSESLAMRIKEMMERDDLSGLGKSLSQKARKFFDLRVLVSKLVAELTSF